MVLQMPLESALPLNLASSFSDAIAALKDSFGRSPKAVATKSVPPWSSRS